jgi:hypothetical protein
VKFWKGKNEKLYLFLSFQLKIKSPLIFSSLKVWKSVGISLLSNCLPKVTS